MTSKHPMTSNDLGTEPYFAILHAESITIPGDERSRTNPGHGYPESTSHYWRIEVFQNKESWVAEIKRLKSQAFSRNDFQAVLISPATITTNINIDGDVK